MSGWIKIHRQIDQHWLSENPERLGAWVTLILMANHQERQVLIGANLVKVERGSFVTSQRKLQQKWGWSRVKFDTFLNLLQSEGMVSFKTTTQYTYVSIINYDTYQSITTTDKHTEEHTDKHTEKPRSGTRKSHDKTTNKNDKNLKNEENEKKIRNPLTPFEGDPVWPTQLDTPQARSEWNRWLTYKHQKRKNYKTLDSHEAALRRCAKDFQTPERLIAAIEYSIAQGWDGIYEEKKLTGGKKQQHKSTGVFGPDGFEYDENFLKNVGFNFEEIKK